MRRLQARPRRGRPPAVAAARSPCSGQRSPVTRVPVGLDGQLAHVPWRAVPHRAVPGPGRTPRTRRCGPGWRRRRGPGPVLRHCDAEHLEPARIGVAEVAGRRRGQRPAGGGKPGCARERGHIGSAWPQVVPEAPAAEPAGSMPRLLALVRPARRPRCPIRAGRQPALRDKLTVGLGDGVPRDAQVLRERPGRRQRCPGCQPAAAYRLTQRRLKRRPAAGCQTARDADRARRKWTAFPAWNWILN